MSEKCFEGRFFFQGTGSFSWCDVLPRCFTSEAGAACRQPGRKMVKKRGFLEVKKLRCFWLNHVRGTETQQNAPAAE